MSAEEIYSKVKKHFLEMKDVKQQGQSLKRNRKMFVMLNKGRFIVKLPEKRVQEILSTEKGLPYDPGTGKHMKEWVIIPLTSEENWIDYAQEAKEFVASMSK
jgi:hypothetical protein